MVTSDLRSTLVVVATLLAGPTLIAQSFPIPLNYNFNGIVHAGESGNPDSPSGFRSISDRALDFSLGVPLDPLLAPYQLVATPGTLDIVHLGNRNTVDNGNHAFDLVPDGDDVGIQPAWLANVDQSGPQTTVLAQPMPIGPTTTVSFLYQISNGGGSFDVTIGFASGARAVFRVSGPDWYGGTFAGTDHVDTAMPGHTLSIAERTLNLGAYLGELVAQITFDNRSNTNAGYAILAAKIDYPPTPRRVNQIPLSYNFNGIVHAGESGNPDAPNGFRSISDRALDFSAGVPTDPLLAPYHLVDTAGMLDIVHLGNRNTVDNGGHAFDPVPDGDDVGIQPTWLVNVDQSVPQTTNLAAPILLDAASSASFLYQISNGGGAFDVTFTFRSQRSSVTTMSGPDWFGGTFLGASNVDSGLPGANLSITERRVDLSAHAGEVLTAITFSNGSNFNAGIAILAANVTGCLSCGRAGGTTNAGGGNGPTLATVSNGNLGCDLEWTLAGATPSAAGFMLVGLRATSPIALSVIFPTCAGTIHVANPIGVGIVTNASGGYTFVIPGLPNPSLCGLTLFSQYAGIVTTSCPIRLSDALGITIGD